MIRIKCEGGTSIGVDILTAKGEPIHGVRDLTVRMSPNDMVRADLEIAVSEIDVYAHPLLGLETVEAAAAAHGFRLVSMDDEKKHG